MKVLLIGKYPPVQGGISTKTYWLYKKLQEKGLQFKAVLLKDPPYVFESSPADDIISTSTAEGINVPWHTPYTSLVTERLVAQALNLSDEFDPDIVEVNYLWPYCMVGVLVSRILGKPLLLRHAGSDILKFKNNKDFVSLMRYCFEQADMVVTNTTAKKFVQSLAGNTIIKCPAQRYIPDPNVFSGIGSAKVKYDILFAGKINYHWRYKGLDRLCQSLKETGMRCRMVFGGKYVSDISALISEMGIKNQCFCSNFVHPEEMSSLINSCRIVWCWEDSRSVEDFSNLILETLYSGRLCVMNKESFRRELKSSINAKFSSQLIFEENNAFDLSRDLTSVSCKAVDNDFRWQLFSAYIHYNEKIYDDISMGDV